jgi:hypothetical protein
MGLALYVRCAEFRSAGGRRATSDESPARAGTPAVTVTATQWELFRALCSRRSASQIRSYQWSGDAHPDLHLLPAYGLPTSDLIE